MKRVVGAILLAGMSLPLTGRAAWAEALYSDALGRALAIFALVAIAYLAFAILLIVLAIRRRWRTLGRAVVIGGLVIIGFPLADSALLHWQQARVKAAQSLGAAADLGAPGVLYIGLDDRCSHDMCSALAQLRGGAPFWEIPYDEIANIDFSKPVDLSRVPMMRRVQDMDGFNTFVLVEPAADQPRPEFTHVVIARSPYYRSRAGQIEAAFEGMPVGTLLGDRLVIESLVAPIEGGSLSVAALQPELLRLYIARRAYIAPLFPENTRPGSRRDHTERNQLSDWFCSQAHTDAHGYACRRTLTN